MCVFHICMRNQQIIIINKMNGREEEKNVRRMQTHADNVNVKYRKIVS